MPIKFRRCVGEVERAEIKRYGYEKYNPYAVCRVSTGFHGSTHHKIMKHHHKHEKHMKKHMMRY